MSAFRANTFVVAVVSFTTLGSIVVGVSLASLNGVLEMDGFQEFFSDLFGSSNTTSESQNQTCSSGSDAGKNSIIGFIVSSTNVGAAIGSVIAGWLSDLFGRKYGLLIGGVVSLVGAIVLCASFYVWMIIAGRLLSGISIGIIYMVMPVYLSEMCPKESRGTFGAFIGIGLNAGSIIALVTNIGFAEFYLGWRFAFAILGVLSLVFAVGMKFMPHTPRWLAKKQRDMEALLVLSKINHLASRETCMDTHQELEELKDSVQTFSKNQCCFLLKEMYRLKYRLFLVLVLFFGESSNGAFIYYYTTTIFRNLGFPGFYSAMVVGFVIFLAAIVLSLTIDKLGRKTLFLIDTAVLIFTGLAIGLLTQLFESRNEIVRYTVVILVCIYAFAYCSSWVTLPWVVNSEVFPNKIREHTVGLTTGIFWLFHFSVNQVTPLIICSSLRLQGFFYILVGFCVFMFFFILVALPETKGVSLEQMDNLFSLTLWEHFTRYVRCSSPSHQGHATQSQEPAWKKSLEELDEDYKPDADCDFKQETTCI